jgi:hypothetical protein
MRLEATLASVSAAVLAVSAASADVTQTIVQVNATGAQLTAAGYSDVGNGNVLVSVGTECVQFGCFSLVGYSGDLAERGYFQFQFNDFNYVQYSGLFAVLDLNYGSSGIDRDEMIALINGQTAITGVTALLPSQAGNAGCQFDDFLSPDLLDAIVLSWMPNPGPTLGGLSQVFTFAWDVNGIGGSPLLGGSAITVDGVYGVPAPGAIALLGLAGLAGRRRR